MKNHIIISLLFLSIGLSQQEYDINDIIQMDNGLFTVMFSDEPITGKIYGHYGEGSNFKKVHMGTLLNGKQQGRWVSYYDSNGKKRYDYNFKDGKRDGLFNEWYENGQKKYQGTWKDDKPDGLINEWFENGQKKHQITWKDGKREGLDTGWYENGQKYFETNNKDGRIISSKVWNEDGSGRND